MKKIKLSRRGIKQGATLRGFCIELDEPAELHFESALCQLRTRDDELVHEFDLELTPSSVVFADVPGSVTKNFPLGELHFDINIRTDDGFSRIQIEGTQKIFHTWSRNEQ